MPALAHVGCDIDPTSFNDFDPTWGFDILKAANALCPNWEPFTLASFWRAFGRKEWANFPVSDEFQWLLNSCKALVGRENIYILTTPILDPDCAAGKMEWIYKYCPKWLHRQYLIGPCKHMCARPNALLIDDSDENVNKFREHGGQALLVPRPWNSLHEVNTMKYLEGYFRTCNPLYQLSIEPPFIKGRNVVASGLGGAFG